MAKFILGFPAGSTTIDLEDIVEYNTKEEADFESEEWVEVEANSLEEAKANYEESFLSWQRDNKYK